MFIRHLKYRKLLERVLLGFIGFIGAGAMLLIIKGHGAGITPDSVAYISVARNLAEGNGFYTFNGMPLIIQPPLYSILLAMIKAVLSIDPQVSAGIVNSALYGLIVYISGLLLLRYLKSFTLVVLGTVSVLISYAVVQSSFMALSEPLFIILVLIFLFYYEKYQSSHNYISFFIFSISSALACLTRYTGVVILITGVICIFVRGQNNIKNKYWHSFVFLLITALPVGMWIIRNYILSGTLVGHRGASSVNLFDNIRLFYTTVVSWLLPLNSAGIYVLFIFVIAGVWISAGVKNENTPYKEALKQIGPSLLLVLLYSGIIIISSTTTAYDKISDRLISPIFIPLIIIIFYLADVILNHLKKYYNPKMVTIMFCVAVVLIMRYPAMNTLQFIADYTEMSGWGYSSNLWRGSEIIDYLNKHTELGKEYELYSNEPEAVYILTNYKTSRSPVKTFYNSRQIYNIKQDQEEAWLNAEKVCLIWFNETNRNFLFTIDDLKKDLNLTEVADLKDGKIYMLSKKTIR